MQIDFDKFYAIGQQMAGDLGRDLVHICYERIILKGIEPKDPDGYFYRMMQNQVREKSSLFNKNYRRKTKRDFDTLECEYNKINTEEVQRIIQELKKQGFIIEVRTFLELAETRNYLEFTRKTGVRYETLIKIVTFVQNEIIKRYDNNSTQ